MYNTRILPLARNGTTGISNEFQLQAATEEEERAFMLVPERVASIGWQVSIPRGRGNLAHYVVEVSMNIPDTIGDTGSLGVWANVYDTDKIRVLDGEEHGVRTTDDGRQVDTTDGGYFVPRGDGNETGYLNPDIIDMGCTANTVRAIRITVLWSTCPVNVVFCG